MSKFSGMTVNERLYHAGLLEEFDAAIAASNGAFAEEILQRTELTAQQSAEIVAAIFESQEQDGKKRH